MLTNPNSHYLKTEKLPSAISTILTPQGVWIEMVPTYKYLDIIINQHLSFQTHIISNNKRNLNYYFFNFYK